MEAALSQTVNLEPAGTAGYLVIDSLLGGGGTGGIRMVAGLTRREVADLAREMSLKFGWLNIPRGGAKAGITYEGEIDRSLKLHILHDFGHGISEILKSGQYVPGMDLGVGPDELAAVFRGAGLQQPPPRNDIDPGFFTALTVFSAIEALLERRDRQVRDSTFLIEGIGKVGCQLLRLIDRAGGRVVGVSSICGARLDPQGIDVGNLLKLQQGAGDACVQQYTGGELASAPELYWQSADVLVPGARTNSIVSADVDRLQVRHIVSAANAVASETVEAELHNAGIAYLPGFVSNSGGILCWYFAKYENDARERLIRRGIRRKVRRLVMSADRKQLPIAFLARRQAVARTMRMQAQTKGLTLQGAAGVLRRLLPQRVLFIALRTCLGESWARRDSAPLHWYLNAKYFS